jgi:hypothetical protein
MRPTEHIERDERKRHDIMHMMHMMHMVLSLVGDSAALRSSSDWLALSGWVLGAAGIGCGVIGTCIGATRYARDRRRDRAFKELLSQVEVQWKDCYTEQQVRALLAEREHLLEQVRHDVPYLARYVFLRDQQAELSSSIGELYRQYEDVTQQLAEGIPGGGALHAGLVGALERDIAPAYHERQRREFWVSCSATALLLVAAVPLALPLLLPLAPLVGIPVPPDGKSLLLAQAVDYILVSGVVYLILQVMPTPKRTPAFVAHAGALFRIVLPYLVLPFLCIAVTVQFFLPYVMAFMGGTAVDTLVGASDASQHAGLGIASAVLMATLLRLLQAGRNRHE